MTTSISRPRAATPSWFRRSVIYCIDVSTFYDANGDGWGDLTGLVEKLDYVHSLGVDAIWLQPFFPSPWQDNGYDICDYLDVDERLGDFAEFPRLLDEADRGGLRVIVDLAVQHTSREHPWFRAARSDPSSPVTRLVRARHLAPEVGQSVQSVDVGNDAMLALRHGAPPSATLTLANLSDRTVEVDLGDELSGPGHVVEVVNDADYDPPCRGRAMVHAYGFRWLRQVAAP